MFSTLSGTFISLVGFGSTEIRFLKKQVFLAGGFINKALETVDFTIDIVNRLEGRLDTIDLLSLGIVVMVVK